MDKLRKIIRNILCEGVSKKEFEKIDNDTILINGLGKNRKEISAIATKYFGSNKGDIVATELDGIYIASRGKYDESKTKNYNNVARHFYG